MSDLDLVGKLLALEKAVSSAGIPHAFGGAIALAAYAEPRGTADLDLGVFLDSNATEGVLSVLGSLGMDTDVDVELIKAGDWGRVYWGSTPVDFFFSYTHLHFEAQDRVRSLSVRGAEIPVLGPEDIIGLKAVFNREKDWADIDSVLQAQRDIDTDVVRRWLEAIYGDGGRRLDERVARFNDLASRSDHTTIIATKHRRWRFLRRPAAGPTVRPNTLSIEPVPPHRTLTGRQWRRPAGSPQGGQFTSARHPEADGVELNRHPPEDR